MKMLQPLTSKPTGKASRRSHSGDERARLYQGRRWRKLRAYVLNHEPLCRSCAARGYVTEAVLVDHIRGHAGNWRELFFEPTNLQPLCRECHDAKTQRELAAKTRGVPFIPEPKANANRMECITRHRPHR